MGGKYIIHTFHARLFSLQHANNQSYTNSILIDVYLHIQSCKNLIKIPFIKSQKFGEAAASPVPQPLTKGDHESGIGVGENLGLT